jgi:hypothetical protein
VTVVYQARTASASEYIDVIGEPRTGYRITRQVIRANDETETNWSLTPEQSAELRGLLGDVVTADDLLPTPEAESTLGARLLQALDQLQPPAEPFTYQTWD